MTTKDKTIIVGRCGKEPELKYFDNGNAVCNISLAVNRGYGEHQKTQWFNVAIGGKAAERANQFINKGSLVWVEGEVSARGYQKQDGSIGVSLDLKTWGFDFIGGKNEAVQSADSGQGHAVQEEDDIPF